MSTSEHSRSGNKLILAIVLSILTYWLFAQSFINISTPVQQTYHTTPGILNLSVSITSFATGIFMVGAGDISDKIGRLKMTYIGIILSIIGSLLIIISDITALLLIGRILQGVSAAILLPSTVGVFNDQFNGKALRRAFSYLMIGSVGGIGLASMVGGLIATYINWQSNFILSIIIAIIAFLLLLGTKEEAKEVIDKRPFDYAGMLIFAVLIGSITLFATQGFEQGWTSPFSMICLSIFVISTIIFYFFERRKHLPFIDFELFRNRGLMGSSVINFVLNSAVGITTVFNMYAQAELGLSSFQSGLVTVPYVIMAILMIRLGEKISIKHGGKPMLLLGPAFPAIGIIFISLTILPSEWYIAAVTFGFVICAIGNGLCATPGLTVAILTIPDEKVGLASGLYKMSATLGGAFGIAMYTTIFATLQVSNSASVAAAWSMITGVSLMIIGIIVAQIIIPKNIKA
ncbi:MFS transporter [Staphylococcus xylosus]|uniref:MFS transporter n=1 Tax=Staphylococcus xylosus TaxID=1288 RepID=UPI000C34AD2E|nr:MFS transporter [Staphylococcus xylosus]MBE6180577.1 MFS transporter [Staphylococcus xylosus]MBM6638790.1 MFS transporter [Staphylococcus xylosus]MCE7785477.1 MFS transporter [Staphylococcus xylosus]MDW8555136.1 MFS transporter [Staphylococcus xylosus]MEB6320802.1 MFS transporter [Staphylococcus xylosus]